MLSVEVNGTTRHFDGSAPVELGSAPTCAVVVAGAPHVAVVFVDGTGAWRIAPRSNPSAVFVAGTAVDTLALTGATEIMLGDPTTGTRALVTVESASGSGPEAPRTGGDTSGPSRLRGMGFSSGSALPPTSVADRGGSDTAGRGPYVPEPRAPYVPEPRVPYVPSATAPPARQSEPTTPPARPAATPSTSSHPGGTPPSAGTGVRSRLRGAALRLGRASDNDLVVDDLLVDLHHAELRLASDGWQLRDLGSASGTFVGGRRITTTMLLQPGHTFVVGRTKVRVEVDGLSILEDDERYALEAVDLVVTIPNGERILNEVSLALEPGKLLAVVGPTGSGKSTLLKALTGFRPPDGGEVYFLGRDLYESFDELRRRIGYVPQDDILHPQLTIRRALEFGAELRFPADVSPEERSARVDEVMTELGLAHRADVPIEKLSGGQRKRTSVALELLTRPALLFLDEPTSGLDPGFEKQVMQLLRELADSGRTVVVVTHSLQSLDLCDQVLFLAPGGSIAFYGPPTEALRYFGRDDFADVFQDLEAGRDTDWKGRFEARTGGRRTRGRREAAPVGPAAAVPPPPVPWPTQVSTLIRRQIAVIVADKRNLGYLGAEMLIPAFLILLLAGSGSLNPDSENAATGARTLIGALVISAAVVGSANSIREIVKETALYQRERSIGLYRSAYLSSKFLVLGVLTAVQVAVIVAFGVVRAEGPTEAVTISPPIIELMADVVLAGIAAVALGLLISALVATSEKAMALVPVIFITMWLFSGISLDLPRKPVMRETAYLTASSWGVAAASSSVRMHALDGTCDGPAGASASSRASYGSGGRGSAVASVGVAKLPACDERWYHDGGHWLFASGMLVVLTAASLGLASIALRKKEPLAGMDGPVDWMSFPDRAAAAIDSLVASVSGPRPPGPRR